MTRKIAVFLFSFMLAYGVGRAWMYAMKMNAKPAPTSARLIDCDPNQVRGIRLLRKDGTTLEFHRLDQPRAGVPSTVQLSSSQWRMMGSPEVEAEASILARLASMACDLYNPHPAEGEKFTESAGAAKGLELVMQKDDVSTVHALDFGPIAADRQALVRYRGAGEPVQVHVTPKLLELSSLPIAEYRNLKVLRLNGDQVMMASVLDGKKERFTLERDGAGWSIHQMEKKVSDGGEKANQYVNRLGTLRALSAKPAEGAKCEARPFKVRIRLTGVGGRDEDLYLDYDQAGPIRACDTARDSFFEVHRDLLKYVDVPAKALSL